jgi:hypothetical protein
MDCVSIYIKRKLNKRISPNITNYSETKRSIANNQCSSVDFKTVIDFEVPLDDQHQQMPELLVICTAH